MKKMTKKTTRRISLVLGSGGARGMAHIGIIHWLEEHGYEIAAISGCSSGALVGGIYAAGKLDEFEKWVCAIDRFDMLKLMDISWSSNGLLRGDKVIDTLKDLVGDMRIEELPIEFTAVATDLHNEKEVWLRQGSLFDAIRASISLPLFFTPFHYQGTDLIDGGVLNPVPIAPTFGDHTDLTIAVNLAGTPDPAGQAKAPQDSEPEAISPLREKVQTFLGQLGLGSEDADQQELNAREVISQTIDTMQASIARQKLAAYPPDKVVSIARNACGLLEFDRARELIDLGYQRAEACLGED